MCWSYEHYLLAGNTAGGTGNADLHLLQAQPAITVHCVQVKAQGPAKDRLACRQLLASLNL